MAKMGDITLTVDSFFIDSRVGTCLNFACRFNSYKQKKQEEANCSLKKIEINQDGQCSSFEPILKDKAK